MRNYTLLVVITHLLLFAILAQAHTPVQDWVARYNGPENKADKAVGVAIDSMGNVFVTGTTNYVDYSYPDSDYATVKYDPNGNELWVAYYDGPTGFTDEACALAIDKLDNVYVTGTSFDYGNSSYYYVTVKYDSDGNEKWASRYNKGPNNEGGAAIVVDSFGNIYIGGNSGSYNSRDYTTIKYDPNGNEIWVALYDGPSNSQDDVKAIVVDDSRNVYVVGSSRWYGGERHGLYDYAIIKYDEDGNEQWVARYDNQGEGNHWGNAIAVDSSGNVYVTGESYDRDTQADYVTIKYDASGNELWVVRYNGPRYSEDAAYALVVDGLGNILVAGSSTGIGTYKDYATVKYDTDGYELWAVRHNGMANGNDEARALALDDSDNIYVTGYCYILNGAYGYNDFETLKYDPNGHKIWVARYDGPAMEGNKATAIAIDDSSNVYVTGESGALGPGTDYATIKYSQPDQYNYCLGKIDGDLNNDCKVDFKDFSTFSLNWLECNLDPPEACWE